MKTENVILILVISLIIMLVICVWQFQRVDDLNEQLVQKDEVIEHHISSIKACESVLLDAYLANKNLSFVMNWTG